MATKTISVTFNCGKTIVVESKDGNSDLEMLTLASQRHVLNDHFSRKDLCVPQRLAPRKTGAANA